jgi:hypothetical protein
MEGSNGSGSDAVIEGLSLEELDELEKELAQYEEQLNKFKITGYGMSGDSTSGFRYEP